MCFPSLEPPKIMVKKYQENEHLTTKGQGLVLDISKWEISTYCWKAESA